MEEENIKYIIEEASKIIENIEKVEIETGQNFNVFSSLRIKKKEIMHSRFIKDLLNPNGTHKQGSIFLNLFLETIKESIENNDGAQKNIENITTKEYNDNCNKLSNKEILESFAEGDFIKIKDEESLGNKNLENETGGFIDIYLKTKNDTHLIIENKVDAIDQPQQLMRYYNSVPNSIILYLTKKKKLPKQISLKSKIGNPDLIINEDFYCISYEHEIINWINKCIKEIFTKPNIKYVLQHYMKTIEKITNKNSSKMNQELAKLIIKIPNSIEVIKKLQDTIKSDELFKPIKTFFIEIKKQKKEIEIINEQDLYSYNSSKNSILINIKSDKLIYPSFKFHTDNGYKNFRFSLRLKNSEKNNNELRNKVYLEFKKKFNNVEKGDLKFTLCCSAPFNNYSNWENTEVLKKLKNGSFEKTFNKIIDDLNDVINKTLVNV